MVVADSGAFALSDYWALSAVWKYSMGSEAQSLVARDRQHGQHLDPVGHRLRQISLLESRNGLIPRRSSSRSHQLNQLMCKSARQNSPARPLSWPVNTCCGSTVLGE